MLDFSTFIDATACCPQCDFSSQKRVFERLSQLLSSPEFPADLIYQGMNKREKLGSTGLGEGIAIPHARLANLPRPKLAVITLAEGIDYASKDNVPVDIFFGIIAPEDASNDHLKILSALAQSFKQPDFCAKIRSAATPEELYRTALMAHVIYD